MREKIDSLIGKFIYALLWFLTFGTLIFGVFVLGGCGPSNAQLLEEAKACGRGPECSVIWDRWNLNEDAAMKRRQAKAASSNLCPGRHVLYCSGGISSRCVNSDGTMNKSCQCKCIREDLFKF